MRVSTPLHRARCARSLTVAVQDKERVAAYKAGIKEQLTRAGLIRGQPRASFIHATSSAGSVASPVAGPGPSSLRRHSPLSDSRFPAPYPSARQRQPAGMAALSGHGESRLRVLRREC